ncbi:MAG: septum formation family protein [Woeseiaceae bacterium]
MKNWGIYIVVVAGYFLYSVMTSADRDESGAIVGAGSIDAFSLRVGDCYDDSDGYSDQVDMLAGVPCVEPHDNEVYAVFSVDLPAFPGDDEMGEIAYERCMEKFPSFVGKDYESSSLDFYPMYPSSESWSRKDDRDVVCALYDMELEKLEGSVKGLAL